MKTKFIILILSIIMIGILQANTQPKDAAPATYWDFRDDSNSNGDLLMSDVIIDSCGIYTYYAFIQYTGGYCGFQRKDTTKYPNGGGYVISSLWDHANEDEGPISEEENARLVWTGYHVEGNDFGGEGTGAHTHRTDYHWKFNQPYRVALKTRPGTYENPELDGTFRDYWIYNFETKDWFHMSTVWRPDHPQNGQEYAGDVALFIEDFGGDVKEYGSCYMFNARKKKYASMDWIIYDHGYFNVNDANDWSADEWPGTDNPPDSHSPYINCKVYGDSIWACTGGKNSGSPAFPDRRKCPSTVSFTPNQNIDQPQPPGLTNIHVENVNDTTMKVKWEYENKKWAAQESFAIRIYSDESMNNSVYKTGTMYPHDYDKFPLQPKDDRFYKLSHREYELSGLELEEGKKYYLRLITKTIFGFNSWNTEPVTIQNYTDIDNEQSKLPDKIELKPNYPNPFNPETQISYYLPRRMKVSLGIYDLKGRKIRSLVHNTIKSAGNHNVIFNAEDLNSGQYFYKLQADNSSFTKKMMLIK